MLKACFLISLAAEKPGQCNIINECIELDMPLGEPDRMQMQGKHSGMVTQNMHNDNVAWSLDMYSLSIRCVQAIACPADYIQN